jgi:hypothetical protein
MTVRSVARPLPRWFSSPERWAGAEAGGLECGNVFEGRLDMARPHIVGDEIIIVDRNHRIAV